MSKPRFCYELFRQFASCWLLNSKSKSHPYDFCRWNSRLQCKLRNYLWTSSCCLYSNCSSNCFGPLEMLNRNLTDMSEIYTGTISPQLTFATLLTSTIKVDSSCSSIQKLHRNLHVNLQIRQSLKKHHRSNFCQTRRGISNYCKSLWTYLFETLHSLNEPRMGTLLCSSIQTKWCLWLDWVMGAKPILPKLSCSSCRSQQMCSPRPICKNHL